MPPKSRQIEHPVAAGIAEDMQNRGADSDIFNRVGAKVDNRFFKRCDFSIQARIGRVDELQHPGGDGGVFECDFGQALWSAAIIIARFYQLKQNLWQGRQVSGTLEPSEYIGRIFHCCIQVPVICDIFYCVTSIMSSK